MNICIMQILLSNATRKVWHRNNSLINNALSCTSLLGILHRQLKLTVICWNYKAVQVNTASVYTLLWWYTPCHMNLTVWNEQLTNKKYRIRLTKYISVLIHDLITHTNTHAFMHLCLCLPFKNIALIKHLQLNQTH